MKIKQITDNIDDILVGATFLGNGASKEAYEKNGIVYKVPRGRYLIERLNLPKELPNQMDEVDDYLEKIYEQNDQMVWPLGQFAIELIVWNAIKQLEEDGLDISCFARITDYYYDKEGVLVIEQESTRNFCEDYDRNMLLLEKTIEEIKMLNVVLEERFDIRITDVHSYNCGYVNGKIKLFDFGISKGTNLYSYDSYDRDEEYEDCEDYVI